jgi:teichoic acid transport system permease protein
MAGLFAYYFVSDSVRLSVKSVTGGGRLILNTAFPRALLPLSGVMTSFVRFLPTVAVYIPVHLIAGLPVGPHLLWVIPLLGLLVVLASGASMLVSSLQVYFRDLKNFCPTRCACGCTPRPSSTLPTRSRTATTGCWPSTPSAAC